VKDNRFELDSLNLDDLDVQELEARLELAVAAPGAGTGGTCSGDQGCGTNCQNCKNCYNGCVTECTGTIG
jgi:hypothetical protein